VSGVVQPDDAALDAAAELLRRGRLVAFPTETVYGLGADATNPEALRLIYDVKGRPADHPLIVHLAGSEQIDRYSRAVPASARRLMTVFWPGPLTIIVERSDAVAPEATGGRTTVGLRVPDHPVALALLRRFDGAVAAPSANRFGRVSPTTANDVVHDLGDDVDIIIDGGPCQIGLESTIVEAAIDGLRILRHGAIGTEEIVEVSGVRVLDDVSGPSRASGMLASHYAPRCRVVLADSSAHARALASDEPGAVDILDPQVSVEVWAHDLYRWLRSADERALSTLIVVPPPAVGLGMAVNDRLHKAAGPRT
jgi:L-threonylcarbamoyladenylate synthase